MLDECFAPVIANHKAWGKKCPKLRDGLHQICLEPEWG
jgi:hypothetical protein